MGFFLGESYQWRRGDFSGASHTSDVVGIFSGLVIPVTSWGFFLGESYQWRRGDFSGASHTSDLKIDTPMATLPGAWRSRVSAGTDWRVCACMCVCVYVGARACLIAIRPTHKNNS